MAAKYLTAKWLGDDANESDLETAIVNAKPEDLARIKEIDNEFKLEMKKLDIDLAKLSAENTKDARKLFAINIWPQIIISAVFITGYFAVLIYILEKHDGLADMNQAMLGVVITIVGVLTAAVPQILNFWFGSSQGSKEKTVSLGGKTQ